MVLLPVECIQFQPGKGVNLQWLSMGKENTDRVLKGTFPAESYQELIEFYKAVNKADNIKLVFQSKT